jgi:hypothetical protein
MDEMLFDWPFKIQMYNKRWSLIFATVSYNDEECIIRFKYKNLQKVIDYIRQRYRETQKWEDCPTLKQHVKNNNLLFLW